MVCCLEAYQNPENGSNKIQYLAIFAVVINFISMGMLYGWPSVAIWRNFNGFFDLGEHLSEDMTTWIASLPLLGAIVGAIIAGIASKCLIGRKTIIHLTTILFFVSWILIMIARDVEILIVGRILGGICHGIIFTMAPLFLEEVAGYASRGKMVSLSFVALILGTLLMDVIGKFLSIKDAEVVASIIPLLSFIILLFVPESPYSFLMLAEVKKAEWSLQIFRGKENIYEEFQIIQDSFNTEVLECEGSLKDLFLNNKKSLFISLFLNAGTQLTGITGIIFYAKSIFVGTHMRTSPIIFALFLFSVQLVVTIFSYFLVDLKNRRCLLITSLVGSIIGLLTTAIYFQMGSPRTLEIVPVISLLVYMIFFSIGMQNVPFIMITELFPSNLKLLATVIVEIVINLVALLVAKSFPALVLSYRWNLQTPFYVYAGCTIVVLILTISFVPETKESAEENVQCLLKGKEGDLIYIKRYTEIEDSCNTDEEQVAYTNIDD